MIKDHITWHSVFLIIVIAIEIFLIWVLLRIAGMVLDILAWGV